MPTKTSYPVTAEVPVAGACHETTDQPDWRVAPSAVGTAESGASSGVGVAPGAALATMGGMNGDVVVPACVVRCAAARVGAAFGVTVVRGAGKAACAATRAGREARRSARRAARFDPSGRPNPDPGATARGLVTAREPDRSVVVVVDRAAVSRTVREETWSLTSTRPRARATTTPAVAASMALE